VYALFLAAGLAVTAGAVDAQPAPDFGSPPSGQYPILFNDHHVYAKPDVDKQNRVLAALVRGRTILVPLRSMFEQMGATVEYDPSTRTAIVSKPGAEVRVTVGKPEVIINGESRPLDVPPIMWHGTVLVPVRVISEGMGAYVQWVPEKRAVVVRYIPAPPPTAPPAPPPTPAPTPTQAPIAPATFATPAPVVTPYFEKYVVGDFTWPTVYNEFVPGSHTQYSNDFRAVDEMPLLGMHFLLEAQYTIWRWDHLSGPVKQLGNSNVAAFVPGFSGNDNDLTGDFGIRVMGGFLPRVYFIEGYMSDWTNYGYPRIGGLGYGLEKLPDLNNVFTFYGRYWYGEAIHGHYPQYSVGSTVYPAGTLSYRVQKYNVGINWNLTGGKGPVFLDAGYQGEGWNGAINAPSGRLMFGPYAGLGIRF